MFSSQRNDGNVFKLLIFTPKTLQCHTCLFLVHSLLHCTYMYLQLMCSSFIICELVIYIISIYLFRNIECSSNVGRPVGGKGGLGARIQQRLDNALTLFNENTDIVGGK